VAFSFVKIKMMFKFIGAIAIRPIQIIIAVTFVTVIVVVVVFVIIIIISRGTIVILNIEIPLEAFEKTVFVTGTGHWQTVFIGLWIIRMGSWVRFVRNQRGGRFGQILPAEPWISILALDRRVQTTCRRVVAAAICVIIIRVAVVIIIIIIIIITDKTTKTTTIH
jgi:hypothetical protein